MAPVGTLWTVPYQVSGKIIRSAAAYGDLEVVIPGNYEHRVDNLKPEFTSKFPHGKIPAWEGADGFKLFEGYAIAKYIATLAPNSGLLGATPEDEALIFQWIHLAEFEFDYYINLIRGLCQGLVPYNKGTHHGFLERHNRGLSTLEKHIATRTFFVGERITLADLSIAAFTQRAVGVTIDAPARAKHPNIIRHMETIINQPKLKEIFGETTYAEKAIQFTPPAKEKK